MARFTYYVSAGRRDAYLIGGSNGAGHRAAGVGRDGVCRGHHGGVRVLGTGQ